MTLPKTPDCPDCGFDYCKAHREAMMRWGKRMTMADLTPELLAEWRRLAEACEVSADEVATAQERWDLEKWRRYLLFSAMDPKAVLALLDAFDAQGAKLAAACDERDDLAIRFELELRKHEETKGYRQHAEQQRDELQRIINADPTLYPDRSELASAGRYPSREG